MLPLVSCQRHTHRYSFELRRGGEKNAIIGLGLHARCPKVIIFSLVFSTFQGTKTVTFLKTPPPHVVELVEEVVEPHVQSQDPYLTATLHECVCAKCKTSKLQTLLCAQISQSWAGLLGRQSSSLFFFRRGFKFFLQQYCGFTPSPNIPMMAGSKMLHHWGKLQFFSNLSKVFLIVHREMCKCVPISLKQCESSVRFWPVPPPALLLSQLPFQPLLPFSSRWLLVWPPHHTCYLNVSAMCKWNREKAKM